jgi:hypothetical protein
MPPHDREQDILQLAGGLLIRLRNRGDLDEATIDAEFLFRFEPTWCEWVDRIRGMMRAMVGQIDNEPLSLEDGARWLVHLESNVGLQVGVEVEPNGTRLTIESVRGGYHCFDRELAEALRTMTYDRNEFEHLQQQRWAEANQTAKIQSELWRLAQTYSLVPSEVEWDKYAPDKIKQQFQSVVNWVIWGEFVPSFPWSMTRLVESKVGRGVKRTIRSHRWGGKDLGTHRLRLDARVRTWAIYYLTRRGGGQRTEQSAVDLWNDRFPDNQVRLENFRDERSRLFSRGARKRLTEPATELELLQTMIKGFSALVESDPREGDIQCYLTENWMLLAPTAVKVIPKVKLGSEYEVDFVVGLADQQYILVEIERPEHKLFTQRGDPSAELSHAQRQVEDWRQWIHENIAYARTIMPGINEPHCWVIIGRRSHMVERDEKALARRNAELHHITILTYDDLLDVARRHLDNLRRL